MPWAWSRLLRAAAAFVPRAARIAPPSALVSAAWSFAGSLIVSASSPLAPTHKDLVLGGRGLAELRTKWPISGSMPFGAVARRAGRRSAVTAELGRLRARRTRGYRGRPGSNRDPS